MQKNKNIFFLITSLRGGGAERQVSYLLNIFPQSRVICLENGIDYDVDKIRLFSLGSKNNKPWFKFLKFPFYVWKIYKKTKIDENTVIISFMDFPNLINFTLSKFIKFHPILSVRTNITEHYTNSTSVFYAFLLFIFKKMYKSSRSIVTNSFGSKLALVGLGVSDANIQVIPNMFDIIEISKQSSITPNFEWEMIFKFPTIVLIGRFKEVKGHKYLINIYAKLKKEIPNLKLILVGDGELKNELQNQVINYSFSYFNSNFTLNENYDVYFAGFVSNPYWFSKNASIFVMPSMYEGLPNVLIEALISGSMCVSADCKSGPREILASYENIDVTTDIAEFTPYGILMPVFKNNVELEIIDKIENEWVVTIATLLKDEETIKSFKVKSIERGRDFDIINMAEKWKKIVLNEL
jgi:glycosyltransferase involved in cell wall biosynthesis